MVESKELDVDCVHRVFTSSVDVILFFVWFVSTQYITSTKVITPLPFNEFDTVFEAIQPVWDDLGYVC